MACKRSGVQSPSAPPYIREGSLKYYRTIAIIATIEILIGGLTFISTIIALVLSISTKTPNVLFFVLLTSVLSALIGFGLLRSNKLAYRALLYFSSVIVLTKVLMLMGIIQINGELETYIPSSLKNCISIIYHSIIIYFLTHHTVREIFDHR